MSESFVLSAGRRNPVPANPILDTTSDRTKADNSFCFNPALLLENPGIGFHAFELNDGWILHDREFHPQHLPAHLPSAGKRLCRFVLEGRDQWKVQNLDFKNAIRINGHVVRQQVLKSGDWIQAGRLWMLFMDGILFSTKELDLPKGMYKKQEIRDHSPRLPPFQLELEPVPWPIELPASHIPVQKPHWFSMLGSSLMISVSALASMAAMAISNPGNPQMLISSGITSMSMAGAFLAYGLIQNRIQTKSSQNQSQHEQELYQNYLNHQEELILCQQRQRQKQLLEQKQAFSVLDPKIQGMFSNSEWQLPLGFKPKSWIDFQHPPLRYDQQESKEAKAFLEFISSKGKDPGWISLKKGGQIQLPKLSLRQKEKLFALWVWLCWNEKRFWIWMDDCSLDTFWHPACQFQGKALKVGSIAQAIELATSHPDLEWVIFTETPTQLSIPENAALIGSGLRQYQKNIESVTPNVLDEPVDLMILRQTLPKAAMGTTQPWHFLSNAANSAARYRQPYANLKVHLSEDVIWDLKKDGPHALVCGMTGSGKSEGMTSLLLQLALNNSSQYLQYMLIDFKGGAFGQIFYEFGHLAGSVTNLEKNSFERFEEALNLELERRQKHMAAFAHDYPLAQQDLDSYNQHHPEDPMSHLFVIVDEFAELKRQQPQSMSYLQQTARIGRSLGVHLILATQKPGGIVDDQILSNTGSRLCFKVANAMESRDVLGHEKASELVQPGEFILQYTDQREDVTSKSWYSRQRVCSDMGLKIYEPESQKPIVYGTSFTPLEKISELIQKEQEQPRWILCPYPQDGKGASPAVMDHITHLEELHPTSEKGWWIMAPEKIQSKLAKGLAAFDTKPVFRLNLNHPELDHVPILKKDQIWQLHLQKQEVLLLAGMDESLDENLINELAKNPNIILVVLSSTFKPAWQKALCHLDRFATEIYDRQQLFELFGQSSLSNLSFPNMTGLMNSHMIRGQFCQPEKPVKHEEKERLILEDFPLSKASIQKLNLSFCLGIDPFQKPIFWSHENILVLAYATFEGARMAEEISRRFYMEDPMLIPAAYGDKGIIQLLDLRHPDAAGVLKEHSLTGKDILWCHQGYSQYSWQLGTPVYNGMDNTLYIHQGDILPLKPIETIEDEI